MADIFLKRIYDPVEETDGARVLVDRLWPRGISKEKAKLTCWLKEIAPSNDLRKWFHHESGEFTEFREKYLNELRDDDQKIKSLAQLCEMAQQGKVTLLYGAKDPIHNQAAILREEIGRRM
jgi:uncharacterized protein YeaO (DUF488 family)